MQNKSCQYCGHEIKGRSDKKFCDDSCRTSYNNSRNKNSDFVRMVNSILKRNRNVLEQLICNEENVKVDLHTLSSKGYNFIYHTHKYAAQNGGIYTFCYEFGYQELDEHFYLLIRKDK